MDKYHFNIDSKRIVQLLVKEFTEGLNEQELELLNSWINASEENRILYQKLYSKEYQKQIAEMKNQFDTKDAWKSVFEEIKPKRRKVVTIKFLRAVAVTASVVLVAGIFYLVNKPSVNNTVPIAHENIKPGTNKAMLTLGDGNQIELNNLDTTILIAGSDINISTKEVIYKKESSEIANKIAYNILHTPRGGKYNLILSDGTKVWLNAASKLRYPALFIGNERRVYVEGEAYFEVAKDKNKPFFVHSGNNRIRVLGTAFNVKAYQDNASTQITLCEGSIELTSGNNINILKPDEQAIINNKSSKTSINQVDSKLYTAWKDGMFMFRKTRLDDILVDLSRWYNANLFYTNQDIKNKEFSLYMNRQENIKNILEMLEATEEISFSIQENNIVVSPR